MTTDIPDEIKELTEKAQELYAEEQKAVKTERRKVKKGEDRKGWGETKRRELNKVLVKRIENELNKLLELATSPVEEAIILELYSDIKLLLKNNDII